MCAFQFFFLFFQFYSITISSQPASEPWPVFVSSPRENIDKYLLISIHLSTAQVLTTLGAEHAPLSPNAHLRLFIWTDIVSLLLQGIGLGLTFSGARAAGPWGLLLAAQGHVGQTIVFIGLLIQALSLAGALSLLATTYVKAGRADRKYSYTAFHLRGGPAPAPLSARFKIFLVVLPLAGVCVLVRCAYRTAAAWGGLGSALARDEVLWLVAEGTLLTEAMVSLAVFHPALWLADASGSGSDGSQRRDRHPQHHHDVEGGPVGVGMLGVGGNGKRFSSGTTLTLTMADTLDFGAAARDSRHDLAEAETGHLMFSPNLIAPSEAGSSERAGSRRGSDGSSVGGGGGGGHVRVFQADPYYRYEDNQSPYDPAPVAPVAPAPALAREYSADITAETRGLSPMEAEAEEDRLEVESFVQPPRKSSKRQSMVKRPAVDEDDQLEAASFVSPPRKSSKRKTTQDEDRLEVESIELPPRKPSKRDTIHAREDDLDAVSLYSQ